VDQYPHLWKGGLRLLATLRPRAEEVEAVKSIDLSVERAETLAFIGPNGAGKSTTIKMLTGILHPTGGTATVLGLTPWKQRQRLAFRIGSVFGQKSQLWRHLPPVDTFNLLARIYELDWTSHSGSVSFQHAPGGAPYCILTVAPRRRSRDGHRNGLEPVQVDGGRLEDLSDRPTCPLRTAGVSTFSTPLAVHRTAF